MLVTRRACARRRLEPLAKCAGSARTHRRIQALIRHEHIAQRAASRLTKFAHAGPRPTGSSSPQTQPDFGTSKATIFGEHDNVGYLQRSWRLVDIFEMRRSGCEIRGNVEIARLQSGVHQLCSVMISRLRSQKCVNEHGERCAILQHQPRQVIAMDSSQRANNRRNRTRVAHHSDFLSRAPEPI